MNPLELLIATALSSEMRQNKSDYGPLVVAPKAKVMTGENSPERNMEPKQSICGPLVSRKTSTRSLEGDSRNTEEPTTNKIVCPTEINSAVLTTRVIAAATGQGRLAISQDDKLLEIKGIDRVYIHPMLDSDVLFFQGNRNHVSTGTSLYLTLVQRHRQEFGSTKSRKKKTACKRAIMEYMYSTGARFVREERDTRRYYQLKEKEVLEAISHSLWYANFKRRKIDVQTS